MNSKVYIDKIGKDLKNFKNKNDIDKIPAWKTTELNPRTRALLKFEPWYDYDVGTKIFKLFSLRLFQQPVPRMLGWLLYGNKNSGKTTLVRKYIENYYERPDAEP